MAGSFMTPAEWELGGEIVDQGVNHPAFLAITMHWEMEVLKRLAEVQESSKNLKKIGVGRTEDPTLIIAHLIPTLHEHAKLVERVAQQLTEKLGGK